jgi:phage major head subunit gpT-like protein
MNKMPKATARKNVSQEIITRAASFAPETYNEEDRTVEVVFSTGADVQQYGYVERLNMDAGAIDMKRLNSGNAPLLNAHGAKSLRDQIGVIIRAWIDNGVGRALVRFSRRDDVAPILQDVQDGIIRNVSVGYIVHRYDKQEREGQKPLYIAQKWEPMEISLVPVPADPSAKVRSADDGNEPCAEDESNRAVAQTEEREMPEKNIGGSTVADQQTVDTRAIQAEAAKAERQRCKDIRDGVRALDLSEDIADKMIEEGIDIDAARRRMIDLKAQESASQRIAPQAATVTAMGATSGDDPAFKRAAMAEAISVRAVQGRHKVEPSEAAREYMNFRLSDVAAHVLEANGERNLKRMSRSAIIESVLQRSAHTTSDFANIVLDAQNKILVKEYEIAPPTYRRISDRVDFTDFKPANLIRLGDFPELLPVGENGEVKSGAMKDSKETAQLETYGRDITLSRKLLINDDMAAFNRLPIKIAQRALVRENNLVFAILSESSGIGPVMADGKRLFSTGHGNISSSDTELDLTTLADGRSSMRKQRGDSDDKRSSGLPLNINARFILAGPELELTAKQLVATVTATKAADYNPYAGEMEVLIDAEIDGKIWYLFADPMMSAVLVHGFLDGNESPRLAIKDSNVDGLTMRVLHDFAAAAVDYRGAYHGTGPSS